MTRRNKRFVVIEEREYLRTKKPEKNLIEFLLSIPRGEPPLELPSRDWGMREIDLE